VIAATHHNLETLVREGNFREDLLGRLSVLRIHVPPLRDHPEDIPELARYFLGRCAAENCLSRVVLTDEAMRRLRTHPWTRGNVRELRNTIERAVVLHGHEGILDPASIDLPAGAAEAPPTWDYETEKGRAVVAFQQRFFQRAFGVVSGSLDRPHPEDWARVAELTQISVRNLRRIVAEIHRDDPGRATEETGAAD
jgi:DNA-binding NtrC family response regulator